VVNAGAGYDEGSTFHTFLFHGGTPITQADAVNFVFAMGDFDRDGVPDLYCLKKSNTGTGRLEVHVLSGASNYQTFLLQTGTPIAQADAANFDFAVGDFDGSGTPDVFCIKRTNTGTGKLEVHVLSGAANYQSFLLQTGTPITQADAANFEFAVGDFDRDGRADLYCLKRTNTGTNKLEVHILGGASSYQTFLLQKGTPIAQADAAHFVFSVGAANFGGIADLYCLKKTNTGTGTLEVHILAGAKQYQAFKTETETIIGQADAGNFQFAIGDFNRDAVPDVFSLKRTNTGTGKLEVHVLNGIM
jgi:ribosomal protein L24E